MTPRPRFYRAVALPTDGEGHLAEDRADIVVEGLEQARDSFELRVFLDNPSADALTPTTPTAGYAGSIYVYARGPLPEQDPGTGARASSTRTRRLLATDALSAAAARAPAADITLVPVPFQGPGPNVDLSGVEVLILAHA